MAGDGNHFVYLNLKAANNDLVSDDDPFITNKIALKCENISMSTTKNVMAIPLPFSGVATGESTALALDFGVATKNISLSGIITEQEIVRKFKASHFIDASLSRPFEGGLCKDGTHATEAACVAAHSGKWENDNTMTVTMTANEIAQLVHASVDSSFLQQHQNFSSLTILIPSRVNRNYQYHANSAPGESLDSPETLPKIPFTYKVRGRGADDVYDASPVQLGTFPNPITGHTTDGITGFVRSFSTTIVPGQPFLEFSLEFEQAFVPFG